jgi:hypothetical protein
MIAREVGEQRDVERRAVDAALLEPVRRHLHRHGLRACRVKLREELSERRDVGVCATAGRQRPTNPLPSVPRIAARRPHMSSACAIHCAHDVLPLVPVTPAIHSLRDGVP